MPERAADLEDAAFQDLWLGVCLGLRRFEEFILRYQPFGMLSQRAQDGKRFGRQQDTLVLCRLPQAPKTLVDGVQPEWGKVLQGLLKEARRDYGSFDLA